MKNETRTNKTIQMVNVWDKPVTLHIGGSPGSGVDEYVIEPGDSQALQEGYCKPVPAAGENKFLPSIIARKSMRTWEDGVRRPTLVPKDEAEAAKKSAVAAIAAWKKSPPKPAPQVPQQ